MVPGSNASAARSGCAGLLRRSCLGLPPTFCRGQGRRIGIIEGNWLDLEIRPNYRDRPHLPRHTLNGQKLQARELIPRNSCALGLSAQPVLCWTMDDPRIELPSQRAIHAERRPRGSLHHHRQRRNAVRIPPRCNLAEVRPRPVKCLRRRSRLVKDRRMRRGRLTQRYAPRRERQNQNRDPIPESH